MYGLDHQTATQGLRMDRPTDRLAGMDPFVIRQVQLPVSAKEAWASFADAEGLRGWLGDEVDLDVAVGAAGTVRDRGAIRRVVVTEVIEGERLGFTWWDEDAPAEASVVTVTLDEIDGATTVTVTESLAGTAVAVKSPSICGSYKAAVRKRNSPEKGTPAEAAITSVPSVPSAWRIASGSQ